MSEMYEEYEAQHKAETPTLVLNNKVYDGLKFVAQIFLPGLGALYFAVAQIWGLPAAENVVGTITAVDVFLGLLLSSASRVYNNSEAKYDGSLEVEHRGDDSKMFSLSLNSNPDTLEDRKEVIFKVNTNSQ